MGLEHSYKHRRSQSRPVNPGGDVNVSNIGIRFWAPDSILGLPRPPVNGNGLDLRNIAGALAEPPRNAVPGKLPAHHVARAYIFGAKVGGGARGGPEWATCCSRFPIPPPFLKGAGDHMTQTGAGYMFAATHRHRGAGSGARGHRGRGL